MVCLLAAPWVQLSVSADNGWPHNALWHHWLMPVSWHFRDCKALLVTSLTHVSGAIASVQTFTNVQITAQCYQSQQLRGTLQSLYSKLLYSSTQTSAGGLTKQHKSVLWVTKKLKLGLHLQCHKWGAGRSLWWPNPTNGSNLRRWYLLLHAPSRRDTLWSSVFAAM